MRYSVLVVVFLAMVVVFSSYGVAYIQGLPTQTTSAVTAGVYAVQGNYDYVATLAPNQVYNTTTLGPGQGTLFVSITKGIDVTFTGTVALSSPGNVSVETSYLVALSGGPWNKTLGQSAQSTQQAVGVTATWSRSFLFNVSQTIDLAKEIGTELQVLSQTYLIQIMPVVTGSLTEAGRTVPILLEAPLNLTISNGVISPTGMSYSYKGNITNEDVVSYPNRVTYRYAFDALFVGSLVFLGILVYYVLKVEKVGKDAGPEDIEVLTRPYREVIATTATLPPGSHVAMEKWDDLVKVADTMGKPIMEFAERGEGFVRRVYWVLDGETSYVFETTSKSTWNP